MTDLQNTYRDRAGRGPDDVDFDAMLDDAVTGGRQLVRQRRRYVGAASGVVVVAGVAAIAVALTPSGRDGTPAASEPSPTGVRTSAVPASSSVATTGTTRLVDAPATPRSAPVSLGLLPEGWKYVGGNSSYAAYARVGDPHATQPGYFEDKIVVGPHDAGEKLAKRDFAVRAGRYSARYTAYDGVQIVSVYVNRSITVDVQIARAPKLTKAQALDLTASLTIRNISNPSHG